MNRRKAIKRISVSFGSIAFSTGLISMVQSCQSDNMSNNFNFFNENQLSFLDRVLEIIIPETQTPGAISLKPFIHLLIHIFQKISEMKIKNI